MPASPRDMMHGNVHGTQSFVYVMASIIRHPGLVAVEVAWRWVATLPLLPLSFAWFLGMSGMPERRIAGSTSAWFTAFRFADLLGHGDVFFTRAFVSQSSYAGIAGDLTVVLLWATACGWVRGLILRRLDSKLFPELLTSIGLSILRVVSFLLFVSAWAWWLFLLWFKLVQRLEPAYVPAFALAVAGTLVLFSVWSVVSWIFPLATMIAMSRRLTLAQSLRAAWASGPIRAKLIEINLVMGIVKVALLVLAMVFSASPLPFSNVATQEFLSWWWFGCFLFWVLASDYFHVVRAAAYLNLWRALDPVPAPAQSSDQETAS